MASKIFVNLPVKDLEKSIAFFQAIGYSFNQQFTDETAACMVISDDIYAMLLTATKFRQFTTKEICDTKTSTEVLLALSFDSREDVDGIMASVLAAGGAEPVPGQDHGFMYQRSFQDMDGHLWEAFWMDPSALKQ